MNLTENKLVKDTAFGNISFPMKHIVEGEIPKITYLFNYDGNSENGYIGYSDEKFGTRIGYNYMKVIDDDDSSNGKVIVIDGSIGNSPAYNGANFGIYPSTKELTDICKSDNVVVIESRVKLSNKKNSYFGYYPGPGAFGEITAWTSISMKIVTFFNPLTYLPNAKTKLGEYFIFKTIYDYKNNRSYAYYDGVVYKSRSDDFNGGVYVFISELDSKIDWVRGYLKPRSEIKWPH